MLKLETIKKRLHLPVSKPTICRILKKNDLAQKSVCQKFLLSDLHKKERFEWIQ